MTTLNIKSSPGVWTPIAGDVNPVQIISPTGNWSAYTPTWTGANSNPSVGNGTLIGRYSLVGKICFYRLSVGFGSTSSGGAGTWAFTLPMDSVGGLGYQVMTATVYIATATNWSGMANIAPSSGGFNVYMPVNGTSSYLGAVRNADNTAAVGTGIPQVGGNYTFINGSGLQVQGFYEVA